MDFAHETKKKKTYVTEVQEKKTHENARPGYPFECLWAFLRECDSIHPLLHKREYL
jgi:hypothetical protein